MLLGPGEVRKDSAEKAMFMDFITNVSYRETAKEVGDAHGGSAMVRNSVWQERGGPEARPVPGGETMLKSLDFILMAMGASHGFVANERHAQMCVGTCRTCTVQVTSQEGGQRHGCCRPSTWCSERWPCTWSSYNFCSWTLPPTSSPSVSMASESPSSRRTGKWQLCGKGHHTHPLPGLW